MPSLYRLPLAPVSLPISRAAATKVDWDDVRAQGLDGAQLYFSGNVLLLRLDGEDALARFRRSKSGRAFLDVLEQQGSFDEMATRAAPLHVHRGSGGAGIRALYDLPVLEGHGEALGLALTHMVDQLPGVSRLEMYLDGDRLAFYAEAGDLAEVEELFAGPGGASLQAVLHDHTGYDPAGWRMALHFPVESVAEGGAFPHDNVQPPEPARATKGMAEGLWAPPQGYRTRGAR